jgi:phytoene dehydrogenase-like protein
MLKHSMGLFVLYFSTKKQYNDVKHHTIIFNERHKDLLDDIFDKKVYITDPSLYLHRPAATDKKIYRMIQTLFMFLLRLLIMRVKLIGMKKVMNFLII